MKYINCPPDPATVAFALAGRTPPTPAKNPVELTRALVLASALRMYAKTGMKANTAYTPKNMRLTTEKITGKKFKARDYLAMADALDQWRSE